MIGEEDILDQICGLKELESLCLTQSMAISDLQRLLASCPKLDRGFLRCDRHRVSGDRKSLQAALKLRPEKSPTISN